MPSPIKVLFAPDYRGGNSYQQQLASALHDLDVLVQWPQGYRRMLPLTRMVRKGNYDILHLHWPEAYYTGATPPSTLCRMLRFPFDLARASRHARLVTTAHNLWPHDRPRSWLLRRAQRSAYRRSRTVIAHSRGAAVALHEQFGIQPSRVQVIPHGNLGETMPGAILKDRARAGLKAPLDPARPWVLMAGRVEPYKGIDRALQFHRECGAAFNLIVAGPASPEYQKQLQAHEAATSENVYFQFGWLSDQEMQHWICASDCVLAWHRASSGSGILNLVRGLGVPIVLPSRLDEIELNEPSPWVIRFDESAPPSRILAALTHSASLPRAGAAELHSWADSCSWNSVGRSHLTVYKSVGQS